MNDSKKTVHQDLMELAVRLLNVPAAMIALVKDDRFEVKASTGLILETFPRSASVCETIRTSDYLVSDLSPLMVCDDVSGPFLQSGYPVVSGFPIRIGPRSIGVVCFLSQERREFTDSERNSVSALMRLVTKSFETSLEEQEKERFFSLGLDLLCIADMRGYFTRVNPAFEDLLGYTSEELCSRPFTDFLHPDDVGVTAEKRESHAAGNSVLDFENRYRCKDGTYRWLSWKAIPIGNVIYASARDVTELKSALDEIHRIELERDRFFTTSLDLLAVSDSGGFFTRVNPVVKDILGYTPEEFCSIPYLDLVHPEDIERTNAEVQSQMKGSSSLSFENRYRCKDGTYRWMSWKSSPVGNVMYGCGRDVTEERQSREEIEKLNRNLITASKLKSEFLANMSHEIRTPINGVLGMVGLLLDTSLSADQTEYALAVKSSADGLLIVINDILDFSKVEAGKLDFEELDFNLPKIFKEIHQSFAFQARDKGISFHLEMGPDSMRDVRGDPGRIRQVMNNLLNNALKFTKKGEVSIRVSCKQSVHPGSSELRVEVADSGIGIPLASIDRLFDPFSQVDASTTRCFGGTGLGLSISKRLVERMGGEIGVVSREGSGSKFWFTIQLGTAVAEVVLSVEFERSFHGVFSHPVRILVAEDNAVNQKIAVRTLEKMGLRADAVANGLEALAALDAIPYDLILMDCQMPEMDGYEATRQIRLDPRFPEALLPIVAMTANAMKGEREKCLQVGMNDYVSKPAKREELYTVLKRWLAENKNSHAA
ncbi:MAG: PAS domain-containing protein [Cryobacterium sp.]|nr:PAS domain-containing protein [Oligoflexia bacterium]